ncbi:F-box/kelch-repeat protein At3g23880-like [Trifolium pratense]|uniref:F-box/kelch-repeat protein At3g23880-like n=1 Tax=Trifolium pratense TaxID=57577 RepID=UPI001E698225|nr:F-box/kelch-repeat protein At3g23880-like [Trifolium pratense]
MKFIQIRIFSVVCSPSLSTNRRNLIGTLTSLPTLPLDLIIEILSRLPVKQLLQLRCVCKLWKSLISDSKFAKKHLHLSTTYTLHGIDNQNYYSKHVLKSYSLNSSVSIAQIHLPSNGYVRFLGSCNGVLCLGEEDDGGDLFLVRLWNPSIRKFKELPPVRKPHSYHLGMSGFGYNPISDNYKVVVVLLPSDNVEDNGNYFSDHEVKVHTLGTDSWKSVSVFPFAGVFVQQLGQYVSGTINWLVCTDIMQGQYFIASVDLGKESYQKVLLPDDSGEVDNYTLRLSVFRDCLCLIFGEDVWVMKEYGNKESWIKLFTISYVRDHHCTSSCYIIHPTYIFEDDRVLLSCRSYQECIDGTWKHISYHCNCKNGTSKFIEFEHMLEVCIESLISPCHLSNARM